MKIANNFSEEKEILFLPDMFLGSYVAKMTKILDENPGYSILQEISSVLSGNINENKKIKRISLSRFHVQT